MPALKRLQWSVGIAAPASMLYQMLVGLESYAKWTSAFGEGLYIEGLLAPATAPGCGATCHLPLARCRPSPA
jgi:hypothetical protein